MKFKISKDEIPVLMEFLAESRDHLEGIEDKVLKLEVSKDADLVNSIFRPIHTIKGSSSFLGLESIERLAHEVEALLDDIRKSRIKNIDSEIIDTLLESFDIISKMLENTAKAIEHVDSSADPMEVEITDFMYEEAMNKVANTRKNKIEQQEAAPDESRIESSTESKAEGALIDADYSKITFPGDMKLQYESESGEHIAKIEAILLTLEKSPQNLDLFNDLFRALHSIKGNTGVILSVIENEKLRRKHFLNRAKEIAHLSESIVQKKRDAKRILKGDEIELLLRALDCLKNLMDCFKTDCPPAQMKCDVLPQLRDLDQAVIENIFDREGKLKEIGGDSLAEVVANSMAQCLEAIEAGLNQITNDETREKALKKLKRSYLNLQKIGDKINHNFILAKTNNALNLVKFMLNGKDPNETLFVQTLANDLNELKQKGDRRKSAEFPDRRKATLPPPAGAVLEREIEARIGEKILKVSQEKIEIFMNLIGELLVSKNNLNSFEKEISGKYDLPAIAGRLRETAENIARISNNLQANIMEIRMLPVSHAFSKFPRLVRDLSKKLNKKIRLEIKGEDTEIDKNIIEALADPLVHMIRNCADHGIETLEERIDIGKPEEGTIRLTAYNQGQYVVIEVSDDGRGIDPQKIRVKAIEKTLLSPEKLESMDDRQVLNLVFLPGFSMAGEVSDVSGRGVGMDVVNTNIEKLGGEVILDSVLGKGTTITAKLPLTMAIGRGLEVEASKNRYYIPLDAIIETLRVPSENISRYKDKEMTVIRNQLTPVYRLSTLLGLKNGTGNAISEKKKDAMVILNVKGQKLGLLVDNYYNETEYVIKPLTGGVGSIDGISGAMITGEGKVNLILDLLRLF